MPGASGGHQATMSCIIKSNTQGPYCIPNEYICSTLGKALGLPIPPCGIAYAKVHANPYWFASLDFNLDEDDSFPPIDPARCVAELPDFSAGLLLFDILVANSDRHTTNLHVDLSARPQKISVFDHSHALFGIVNGRGRQRLADLRDELGTSGGPHTGGNRHCLLDHIATVAHFDKWVGRIRLLPDYLIRDTCEEVIDRGIDQTEANTAVEFLTYRRDHLMDIVKGHQREFKAITQWSLL